MNTNMLANIKQSLGAKMAPNDTPVVKDSHEDLNNHKNSQSMVDVYLENKELEYAIGQEETKEPSRSR